jgi:transcription initiation factor TFIIB
MLTDLSKENTITENLACPGCNTDKTIITDPESGEIFCSQCGLIICDRTEDYAHYERRAYSMEEANDRSRTGTPTTLALHDRGLSTIIGRSRKDANGHILSATTLSRIEKLRIWESRIHTYTRSERSFQHAFVQLAMLRDRLGLSNTIVEKAAYIFRKVCERGLLRGRTIEGMLAAAVLIACREMGSLRTIKDIAAALSIPRKDISRNYSVLIFELGIKVPLVDPIKCVARVANALNVNEKLKHRAFNMMTEIVENKKSAGKDPMGLAATVLYMSSVDSDEGISQNAIAAASGVTEVTIRNRLKELTGKHKIQT